MSEKEERESLLIMWSCLCVCVQVCASVWIYIYILFFCFFACAACFSRLFWLKDRPARSCFESLMICNQNPSRLCSGYMSTTQTHDKNIYIYIYSYIYIHIIHIYTFFNKTFLAHRSTPRSTQTRSCFESLMICNQNPSRLCSGYMSMTQTHDLGFRVRGYVGIAEPPVGCYMRLQDFL